MAALVLKCRTDSLTVMIIVIASEAWLDFFAEAVLVTATQAVEAAQQLLDLSNSDRGKISGLGRAAASTTPCLSFQIYKLRI